MRWIDLTVITLISLATFAWSQTRHDILWSPRNGAERMEELLDVQEVTLAHVNELRADGDGHRFSRMMEQPLLAQTFALVDRVRGWARTTVEDDRYRRAMLRFLRISTANRIMYMTLRRFEVFNQIFNATRTRAENETYARVLGYHNDIISAIRDLETEMASAHQEEQPLRDAILTFYGFEIGVLYRPHMPGGPSFRIFFTSWRFIRFADNGEQMILTHCNNSQSMDLNVEEIRQLTTRPLPMRPFANFVNDLNLLYLAQRSTLEWARQLTSLGCWRTPEDLLIIRFVRDNIRRILHEVRRSHSADTNLDFNLLYLSQYVLFGNLIMFLHAEFCTLGRMSERIADELNSNARIARRYALVHNQQLQLQEHTRTLSNHVHNTVNDRTILYCVFDRLRQIAVHVEYQLNRPEVGVFIRELHGFSHPVQAHLNYENFTENNV